MNRAEGIAPLMPLLVAAFSTVAATVSADLVAGSHIVHVLALGLLALTLGGIRLRSAGRHRVVFGAASAALAAQPVLHVAAAAASRAHEPEAAGSIWSVLAAAAFLAAVGAAEQLAIAVGSGVGSGVAMCRRMLRLLTSVPGHVLGERDTLPELRAPSPPALPRGWFRYAIRRGPPA